MLILSDPANAIRIVELSSEKSRSRRDGRSKECSTCSQRNSLTSG